MRKGKFYTTGKALPPPQRQGKRADEQGRSIEERVAAVFDFIVQYTVAHMGHTPTLREIVAATNLSSTSIARNYVLRLVEDGKLGYLDGLLVLPGSKFSWNEPIDGAKYDPALPAQYGAVEAVRNESAGLHDSQRESAGGRPLLPGRKTA